MRRIIAVLIAIGLAAGIVFVLAGTLGGVGELESAGHRDEVLELVESGTTDMARSELERLRDRLREADLAFVEGAVLLGEGRAAEAVEHLERAHAAVPDDPRRFDYLIGALVEAGRQDVAWRRAGAFLVAHPNDLQALWIAARTSYLPGDPDRCVRALQVLGRLEEEVQKVIAAGEDPGVHVLQYLHLWANAALEAGRHREALLRATQAVQHDRRDAPSHLLLAAVARRTAMELGERSVLPVAAQAYRDAVKLDPSYEVCFDAAQFLLDYPDAEKECLELAEALYRSYPGRTEAAILYARALVRQGKNPWMDEAVEIYEAVLKKEPENLVVLRNLAVLLYDWKQGGQRGVYLAQAHGLLRRYEKAGGPIDAALADTYGTLDGFASGDAAAMKAAAAHAAFTRGDLDEALRLYREAAEKDPGRIEYRLKVVALLIRQPDKADELEQTSRALYAAFRDDPRAAEVRAEALMARLGNIQERLPERSVTLQVLGDLCLILGEHPDNKVLAPWVAFVVQFLGGSAEIEKLRMEIPEFGSLPAATAERVRQALLSLESQ